MPLKKAPEGATPAQRGKVVSANIRQLKRERPDMPHKQAVVVSMKAAAGSTKRGSKKKKPLPKGRGRTR